MITPRARERSAAQWFCLVGGGALAVRGLVGVALDPSFGTPGEGWHQLFHLSSGLVLLALARDAAQALAGALSFGLVYAGIALAGIVDGQDVVGLVAVEASDNTIHTLLTLTSLAAGLWSLRRWSAVQSRA